MSKRQTPSKSSRRSPPGPALGLGSRGELAVKLGGRELGHLHGSHAAHFGFPKQVWAELHRRDRMLDLRPGQVGDVETKVVYAGGG